MNRVFLKATAFILSVLLVMPVFSCSQPQDDGATTTALVSETEEITETGREQTPDTLPDNLDLGGETVPIYAFEGWGQLPFITGPEELTGEIVDDAILARNISVMERLNIVLKYEPVAGDLATSTNDIKKFVTAGDDAYDIVVAPQYSMINLAASNFFVNAFTLEYMDFDMPWWWNNYMNEISIGYDTRFFLVGDFFLNMLLGTRILYFNKNMYTDYFGETDELYDSVLAGTWTLDKMKVLIDGSYADLNGNSEADAEDRFGFVTYGSYSSTDAFAFGTDVKLTTRDEEGIVALNAAGNEKAADLLQKLLDIFWCQGSWIYDSNKTAGDVNILKFIAGQSLFLGNASFNEAAALRDMQNDFGVVPYPKYDDSQQGYRSLVHDAYNLGIIPITCGSLDTVGAVVEALCAETYRSVINPYYETALKIKYTRDELSSMVIDIVHDSVNTEFAFAYYSILGSLGSIYRELITGKKTDFASQAEKYTKTAEKALEKLIAAYQGE